MKFNKLLVFTVALASGVFILSSENTIAAEGKSMYRMYNPNSGEHFYTKDVSEKTGLINVGWKDEGIGWTAPSTGDPVYRLYNPNSGDHHYTLNTDERDHLVRNGWKTEGTGWNSDPNKEVPLYRGYNPNAWTGSHNYTTDKAEQGNLISAGWKDEGIAWYGITGNGGSEGGYSEQLLDITTTQETVRLLNEYRTSLGLEPVEYNKDMQNATDVRAKELVTKFDHTRPDNSRWTTLYSGTTTVLPLDEVIAKIPASTATNKANQALTLFKNSFEHNAAIKDSDANVIGASYYQTANGTLYVAWNLGYKMNQ